MGQGMTKAERLRQMEHMYFVRAYSDIEMAEALGVDRTTAYRDRLELETNGIPLWQDDDGRYRADRSRYLSEIRLNLNEALALYLAARRASQQTRLLQPHTAAALGKLAAALRQPMMERLVRQADKILSQQAQPERVKILETAARAWVECIKLQLTYRGLHSHRPTHHRVAPYLIEPSPWGDGAYLIGHSNVFDAITPFKIERIESASLTTERFEIPQDFDEASLLKYAWGIWYAEGEPVTVRLRFRPGTAAERRVRESIWHPTQAITDLPEGGCEWSAQVAEPQEMVPWVRGWGSDVEVLAPQELRELLMGEAKAMAEAYGWYVSKNAPDEPASVLDDFFGG